MRIGYNVDIFQSFNITDDKYALINSQIYLAFMLQISQEDKLESTMF